jgi:N-methylhydantoinase B
MNNVLFGGIDPRSGRAYVHYETLAVGAGGSASGPGATAVQTHMTNTLNTPIEELERLFPVRIDQYAARPAPATQPGVHAGGAGVRRAYHFLGDAQVTIISERRRLAPWGIGGAPDGERGRNRLVRANGTEQALAGKVTLAVRAGDVVIVETPGGGSWRPATPA